jgi:flagellar hook-associated protein 1
VEVDAYDASGASGNGGFPYSSGPLATRTLTFDPTTGALSSGSPLSIAVPNGQTMSLDLGNMTQLAAAFNVTGATANGNAPSGVSGVSVGANGALTFNYANGTSTTAYDIPLANVASPDNLTSVNGDAFLPNSESGPVYLGTAGGAGFGSIESSSLESSTVDLATELTEMIQAQSAYEANSKVFQTGADILDVLNGLKPWAECDWKPSMSLSAAFNVISSSFAVNSAQTALVSNNIANANTPGYSREIANVVTNSYGGADVASVTREANAALLEQVSNSTSQAATQQAISDGLSTLAQTVDDSASASSTSGANQNGASPSAMLANLQTALSTYGASPTSSSAAQAVVSAASALASSLNGGSATVAQVHERADQNMATSVGKINSLLSQFTTANNAVVTGLQTGANVASAEDARDSIVTQLSQQIGVSTVTAANGSESIYTDSGVALFQDTPRLVSFTPTPTLVDGASGAPVTIEGVPITGVNSPMPIQSGTLAGYAALRDTLAPEYQAQLDQIAGGLINAFAESDQSATPTLPSLPGLFATAGATSLPSMSATTGLAAAIEVNPNVDPSQGGNPNLLRDGGISDPGNPAYTYNPAGSASFTGRIQELAGQISASQSFDPSAGLGSSSSLADYANASVSWLQSENQQASNASSYQSALATQATGALSNATGVNSTPR